MTERTTIIDFVEKYVAEFSDNTFLWEKVGDVWEPTTYSETLRQAYRIGAGLWRSVCRKGRRCPI